ncbi:hypothetical protein BDW69DRAFT_180960 [Aspergillus filifer]
MLLSNQATELIELIADMIDSQSALLALSRTSKRSYKIVNRRLMPYNIKHCRSSGLTELDKASFKTSPERTRAGHCGVFDTPFWIAVKRGREDFAILLLENGVNVWAAEILKLILDDLAKRYPESFEMDAYVSLAWAADQGNTQILQMLITDGPSADEHPSARGGPLYAAIEGNHYEAVKLLLGYGASLCHDFDDLDDSVSIVIYADDQGCSILDLLLEESRTIPDEVDRARVQDNM